MRCTEAAGPLRAPASKSPRQRHSRRGCTTRLLVAGATNGDSTRDTAMQLPVASITTSSVASRLSPKPSSAVWGHVDPAGMPELPFFANRHLTRVR